MGEELTFLKGILTVGTLQDGSGNGKDDSYQFGASGDLGGLQGVV